jgi:hypothetical protein
MRPWHVFNSAVLAIILTTPLIQAQVVSPPTPVVPPVRLMGGINMGAFKMKAVKGEPYSLTSKTTISKKLTDGTWTTTVLEEHHLRDSEGRERSDFVK